MPNKSQILWPAYTGFQSQTAALPLYARFVSHRVFPVGGWRFPRCHRHQGHASSTSAAGNTLDHDPEYWPKAAHHTAVPTPYEIFKQKKGSPYSKRRFYELVKIYHPDRNMSDAESPGCVSRAIRLERYRLIVAANDILSDPVKRDAYDRWGAGWSGRPEVADWASHNVSRDRRGWSGFNDNRSHRSAAGNATWEDWERWRDRKEQAPMYFSNGGFVFLIVMFAIVGGVAELSRAKHMSKSFLAQIEGKHDETSKELMRVRMESQNLSSQEQRVQNFMKMRNSAAYGVSGHRGTEVKILPPPEVCTSGATEKKGSGSV